ncbi:PREDICTED: uncharacterized protein LOC109466412 [Branchiostoma belcheri]|uniref:Uncharacterized protein LOC109466412 n=1 Tax=Branchiostoma belcheri TaxID=7741 RepID=A0A6P4YLU9_BRABE|nr:PREDICTED: uncharacterized protein LOC109466412 [Branchiostoma belcheri]
MDDSDCSEVTFDDLGWDCFFPCLPEKGVDLSGIYVINPAGPRRWQEEEEGEQSSSEDEDVDPVTRALPLKSYLISEVGGATATPGEPQWYCQDEGNLDDFDWDNYVPARLGRYKPTYAFVLTHGHGHNPSLYYDKDTPLYDNRRDYGSKDGPFCGSFPTYSACAPHYNTVAIEPRDARSGNCYVYENFEAENGRQNVLRTVNPQYLMFPPPEELYQSFNKATGGANNTRPQNHYKHKYQTGNSKHSFASQKTRFGDNIGNKKTERHSSSSSSRTTVNQSSKFAVSSGKVNPESSFRLKSRPDTSTSWTKSLSRTNSPGLDGSTSSNVTKLGQETNNKENRGNRPPENPVESDRNRNVTTKSHQNAPPEGKRRRVRRFFLGYMKTSDSLNDIKEAIYSHAREKGVELTYVRMMKNERQGVVFARVNVAIEQANIVLQENFWPSDMIFRPWLSKAKYKEQGGTTTTRMPHIEEEHALEVSC